MPAHSQAFIRLTMSKLLFIATNSSTFRHIAYAHRLFSIHRPCKTPQASAENPAVDKHKWYKPIKADFRLVGSADVNVAEHASYQFEKAQHTLAEYGDRRGRSRYSRLCARVALTANAPDLALISDFMHSILAFDDVADGVVPGDKRSERAVSELEQHVLAAVRTTYVSPDAPPIARAFAAVASSLRERRGDAWVQIFAQDMGGYIAGNRLARTYSAGGTVPSWEMFEPVRLLDCAVPLCVHITTAVETAAPPPNVLSHPVVAELTRMGSNYMAWVNDVFSAPKELDKGALNNAVFVVAHEMGLSYADAGRMVVRKCNAQLDAIVELRERLPYVIGEHDAREATALLDAMTQWMRGLLEWSFESRRYK